MNLSRRSFLKLSMLGLAGSILRPWERLAAQTEFPQAEYLGRVAAGMVELKTRPDLDSQTTAVLYEDAVVTWLREVVGTTNRANKRWVETPEGYIWAPYLQPVKNLVQVPLETMPETSTGKGIWVEVSVPYVDLILDNPPARSPLIQDRLKLGLLPRLYYSQVVWVDQVKTGLDGALYYRVNEKYGTYGDQFWARASSFRQITAEDISPISPQVENKLILVNTNFQTMSCYEDGVEVFFARISSGAKWDAWGNPTDAYLTPSGEFPIWRKLISLHMSGGTTGGGWDLPGVGWVSLFVGSGVAIHATFWHNNYGEPMSRGCVNARPEDSRWVFRWALPAVSIEPGDMTAPWPGGTRVRVVEG